MIVQTYSEEEKKEIIEGYKSSGMPVATYAKERGMPESTLRSWLKEALHQPEYKNINWQRRLILFLVRHRMFWALQILGKMRQRQKLAKSGKIPFSII